MSLGLRLCEAEIAANYDQARSAAIPPHNPVLHIIPEAPL